MDELVRRLSEGWHPVVVALRPERTLDALKECIERRHVHIKFIETRGGTELAFGLDPEHSNLTGADFANQAGSIARNGLAVYCPALHVWPGLNDESLPGR